jgi:UMF1 family MFS transporter
MAIVALSAPFLGGLADRAGLRRPLFIGFTVLSVATTALLATVTPGRVVWGFLLAVLSNVGFEGAIVYYNSYLPDLAPPSYQGRVSAWGFAVGYAGSIVALLVALPFVRVQAFGGAFVVTAILFGGFALPAFFCLPAAPGRRLPALHAARTGAIELLHTIRRILDRRDLRRFLGAYFLYEDGVNTVVAFSAIFAAQTLGFSMPQLITLYIVVQIAALLGAMAWSWPTDRLGPKRVVMYTLWQWTLVVVAAYFVQTQAQFYVIAMVAGTGIGAVQAASRTFLTTLIPHGMEAELFGFYALCGKSAAVFGPLLFGTISHAAGGNQRLGIVVVGLLFLLGLVVVRRVQAGGPTAYAAHTAVAD